MFQFTLKYTNIIHSKAQNIPNLDFDLKPSGNPAWFWQYDLRLVQKRFFYCALLALVTTSKQIARFFSVLPTYLNGKIYQMAVK
jgi:hypothetical protein